MIDLKKVLTDYADSKKYKLKEMDNGIFSLDISMKLSDGSMRYQYVWIWVIPGRAKGQDCIYLNSRVGTFNPTINLYGLMKDSGAGVYSSVTIVNDKDKQGNPCESIVVHASPIQNMVTEEEFLYILWEVAERADILEERYFGGDDN